MSVVPGKRGLDLMIATAALVASAPLLALAALAVRLDAGPPILFRQRRIGRHCRPFEILKFRTMRPVADGAPITVGADPRITRSGHWLRRSKLDELPQLINVLRGEMSLIGFRPEVPRYVAAYDRAQRRILRRRPGITDPASIRYRAESELLALASDPDRVYRQRIMPDKLALSARFAAREDLSADWRVLWATLRPRRQTWT
jgi:lipopolysaccharide/colanic/teichoic acid biosynthesis glycosyltransferase